MKDTFYFQHDFGAQNDPKIIAMKSKYGAAGYGLYWSIIEFLHSCEEHKLPTKEWQFMAIAKHNDLELEYVKNYINDCAILYELLVMDDHFFWSERVFRNLQKRDEISQKRAEAGRKGGFSKQESASAKQTLANAKQKVTKEKKEKEIKGNNINIEFQIFWDLYGKKEDKVQSETKWNKLTNTEREQAIEDIPKYISSLDDRKYQKSPRNYLNGKCWQDERTASPLSGKNGTETDTPRRRYYLNESELHEQSV